MASDLDALITDKILHRAEGVRFEVKRVKGKMVQKALETICAFSNTGGGIFVLGVEDPKKASGTDQLFGLSENLEAVAELKRKLRTHFEPSIVEPRFFSIPIRNRTGELDKIAIVQVTPSTKVHSILDDGTWIRVENTNRELYAEEIINLSYKRGVVSAETELVDVDLSLINTESFKIYCEDRGLRRGSLEHRLETIGLAKRDQGKCRPTKAAVLLFAESPTDLLALSGGRAGVRVFHYSGTTIDRSENPNLRKPPKNMSAPIYGLIAGATSYVLEQISEGFEMASGFAAKHAYPRRVVKEAITNAILHRDYRYQLDVHVRIFDDRIEVESPGEFPANITPSTVEKAGSKPRNPSLVNHLREFQTPPNVDAGEGVPMMFNEMKVRGLYPPRYFVRQESAIPTVTVILLNEQRPAVWEQVSAFIDKNGAIANRDLRKIANLETLRATRMLKSWVEKGLLVRHGKGKGDATYQKPISDTTNGDLLLFDGDELSSELGVASRSEAEPVIKTTPGVGKRLVRTPKKASSTQPPRHAQPKRQKKKRRRAASRYRIGPRRGRPGRARAPLNVTSMQIRNVVKYPDYGGLPPHHPKTLSPPLPTPVNLCRPFQSPGGADVRWRTVRDGPA